MSTTTTETTAASTPRTPPRGGRLARYAAYQMRDYIFERGIPLLIVGALFAWIAYGSTAGLRERLGPGELLLLGRAVWNAVVPQLALFGTILALNGIVARDLREGYFRFLFAKPVRVTRFYAQAYVVYGLGLGIVAVLFFGAFALALGLPLPWWAVLYSLLYYVALGGIVFLASTASVAWLGRFDWLAAGALWGIGGVVHALAQQGRRWAELLSPVLPPSWRVDAVLAALLAGRPAPTEAVMHLLGYGAVCFLLGLVVLRHRSLAA